MPQDAAMLPCFSQFVSHFGLSWSSLTATMVFVVWWIWWVSFRSFFALPSRSTAYVHCPSVAPLWRGSLWLDEFCSYSLCEVFFLPPCFASSLVVGEFSGHCTFTLVLIIRGLTLEIFILLSCSFISMSFYVIKTSVTFWYGFVVVLSSSCY